MVTPVYGAMNKSGAVSLAPARDDGGVFHRAVLGQLVDHLGDRRLLLPIAT